MKRLAILGASGHGKVVAEIGELSGWDEIVFFDDNYRGEISIEGWSVEGNTSDLISHLYDFDGVVVAVGNNNVRLEKFLLLQSMEANLVSLFHPTSVVSRYARVGVGTVIMAGAVVNPFATLGMACIVNTGATVDHDCFLADGVHISPGANLAGAVKIGKNSWVGIGASVKQCVQIGENVIIGAGSVVISEITDEVFAYGVPAKVKSLRIMDHAGCKNVKY